MNLDAAVTSPADLPRFDDGNGYGGAVPPGRYQIAVRNAESVATAVLPTSFPPTRS